MGGMLLWCNNSQHEHALGWHRDLTWWGTGKPYFSQQEVRGDGPEAYSEEVEKLRWEEIREKNTKGIDERNGVSMFLALVDEECHELIPGSHNRWRTPFEHDVLLPKKMKDQGVPHTPSWNGEDPLPGQVPLAVVPGADHGFKVAARGDLSETDAMALLVEATLEWLVGEVLPG